VDLSAPALRSYAEPRFPWRRAALVTGGIAAVELVVLVVIGLAFAAKPFLHDAATTPAKAEPVAAAKPAPVEAEPAPTREEAAPAVAKLARTQTPVLVLNGNGVTGAAGTAANRVRALRYPVAGVADASRRDFPRTLVMYGPGLEGEAVRLAMDLGLGRRAAVPLDGMRPGDLGRAKLALVIGG